MVEAYAMERELHRAAEELVRQAFAGKGLTVEDAGAGGAFVVGAGGRSYLLRVLVAAAPHLRGGRGNLGLHWMFRDAPADFLALVDLSRRRGWLMPSDDFRRRAVLLSGPRFHLDWLVARLGPTRSRVADESEFDGYRLDPAIDRYFRRRPAARYRVSVTIGRPWAGSLDRRALAALARRVLTSEGVAAPAEVSIVVTDDDAVRELNRRHLGLDEPTDVLSFPLGRTEGFVAPPGTVDHLGEVIIAGPTAERQAEEAGHSLADETAHLLVHGVLHLLGYDHLSPADERRMRARESQLLGRDVH